MKPQIQILLGTFNGAKYLPQQLESLLAQTYTNWKALLSDDGSTDETNAILAEYCHQYPDHFELFADHKKHTGACKNFMDMLTHSNAAYTMFCDQDDVWMPHKLERTLVAMQEQEVCFGGDKPVIVFSDLLLTDADLKPIFPSYMAYQKLCGSRTAFSQILVQNVATGCTVMINASLRIWFLRTRNTDDIIMHDWWLALIAARFGSLCYIPEPLVYYRQHSYNAIGASKSFGIRFLIMKLSNFKALQSSISRMKKQGAAFGMIYANDLTPADRAMLDRFSKPHSGASFYFKNRIFMNGKARNIGLLLMG